MDNKDLIAKTRALLEAADDGPWKVCPMDMYVMRDSPRGGMVADTGEYDDEAPEGMVGRIRGTGRGAPQAENLRLIAAAPELLAALADALERADAGEDDHGYPL